MGSQGVLLGQRKRWRRTPPSSPYGIDWSHPLTSKLALCWLPGLEDGPSFGGGAVPTKMASQYANGKGTRHGTGSDTRRYFAVPSGSPLAGGTLNWPASVARVGRASGTAVATTGSGMVWGIVAGTTDTTPYHVLALVAASTNYYLGLANGSSLVTNGNGGAGYPSPTQVLGDNVDVGTARSGSQSVYRNGVRVGTGTATLAKPSLTTTAQIVIDCYPADDTRYLISTTTLLAIWTRELTANEVAEFSADPFCFLRY